jgi:hypothetical protein
MGLDRRGRRTELDCPWAPPSATPRFSFTARGRRRKRRGRSTRRGTGGPIAISPHATPLKSFCCRIYPPTVQSLGVNASKNHPLRERSDPPAAAPSASGMNDARHERWA